MPFIKRSQEISNKIKDDANKGLSEHGKGFGEVYNSVMDIHNKRINGDEGKLYMHQCLKVGVEQNSALVADYLAENDSEFAVNVMALALTKSALDLSISAFKHEGWVNEALKDDIVPREKLLEKLVGVQFRFENK
ncbi:MAG: hypothetical protein ACRC0G_07150 [Fusobacteriaceae bacterium]